jgi:hypothetical protein
MVPSLVLGISVRQYSKKQLKQKRARDKAQVADACLAREKP